MTTKRLFLCACGLLLLPLAACNHGTTSTPAGGPVNPPPIVSSPRPQIPGGPNPSPPAGKGPQTSAVDPAAEKKAEEAIKKAGGSVDRDRSAKGEPAIGVDIRNGKDFTDANCKDVAVFVGIQNLRLEGTPVTDAGLKELAGLKNLRMLSLFYDSKITDDGLKVLANFKELRDLNLNYTPTGDAGLKEVAGLKHLEKLNLGQTNITGAGLKELAALPELKVLYLAGPFDEAGVKAVAQLKTLQELTLIPNNFPKGPQPTALKELAALENLRILDIQTDRIPPAGLKSLAVLPHLEELNVSGSDVTDAHVKELAAFSHLKKLDLSNGEFTAGGLKALAALKDLKELNLSGSNAKAADVADLKKALPECKIEGAK